MTLNCGSIFLPGVVEHIFEVTDGRSDDRFVASMCNKNTK